MEESTEHAATLHRGCCACCACAWRPDGSPQARGHGASTPRARHGRCCLPRARRQALPVLGKVHWGGLERCTTEELTEATAVTPTAASLPEAAVSAATAAASRSATPRRLPPQVAQRVLERLASPSSAAASALPDPTQYVWVSGAGFQAPPASTAKKRTSTPRSTTPLAAQVLRVLTQPERSASLSLPA